MLVDSDQTVASHAAHASTERERWSETKITLTADPTKTNEPTNQSTNQRTNEPADQGWWPMGGLGVSAATFAPLFFKTHSFRDLDSISILPESNNFS